MKIKGIILFMVCSQAFSYAQSNPQNLIYNGSFEQIFDGSLSENATSCINPNTSDGSGYLEAGPYSEMLLYADYIYGWTIPRKRILCGNIGTANVLCGTSRSGVMAEWGGREEFLVAPLRENLNPNSTYYVEIYNRNSSSDADIGFRFYDEQPKHCKGIGLKNNGPAHIKVSQSNGAWTKTTLYYKPSNIYSWITLGSFNESGGYSAIGPGYFDDLRIFEVGDDKCADGDWFLQNTDLYNWVYSASDKVVAGANVTSIYYAYTGEVKIKANNFVWFKAGTQVILEPGFSTEDGAYFETIIEPGCQPFEPCQNTTPPNGSYNVCGTPPITIGPTTESYMEYSWSPTTYLSDPTIPNPVFTPPPTGTGTINYTLTLTPLCGGFINSGGGLFGGGFSSTANISYDVTYNSNPNPNPSVTITNQIVNQGYVEFDATVASETEVIFVQVLNSSGQSVYSQTYLTSDIGCCNFNWSTDEMPNSVWGNINTCEDYQIIISTSNYCFPAITDIKTINWSRATTSNTLPIIVTQTNLIAINGIGAECLLVETANADDYSIQIQPSGQVVIYQETGVITGDLTCVWDGSCNMNSTASLFCGNNGCADGGFAYFLTLTLNNCHGLSTQDSWFAYLFYDTGYDCNDALGMKMWNGGEITDEEEELRDIIIESMKENGEGGLFNEIDENFIKDISVFPNPSDGKFYVVLPNPSTTSIKVLDLSGKIVFSTTDLNSFNSIDLSYLAKGVYLLKAIENGNSVTKKIVIE